MHMGKDRKKWYIHNNKILPEFDNTVKGKTWRRKLQDGRMKKKDWKCIPKQLRGVYQCAQRCKTNTGARIHPDDYGDIFTRAITLEELDKYITKTKKNTAPGKSGIRIDHIAALPDEMRGTIAALLSLPYTTGIGYEAWKQEIVNWIPKENNNPDINKRRPLMYYEVLKKMFMGIRLGKIMQIWKNKGIIDENNYAFLTGKSTTQPLMIKKMILEEVAKLKKKLLS